MSCIVISDSNESSDDEIQFFQVQSSSKLKNSDSDEDIIFCGVSKASDAVGGSGSQPKKNTKVLSKLNSKDVTVTTSIKQGQTSKTDSEVQILEVKKRNNAASSKLLKSSDRVDININSKEGLTINIPDKNKVKLTFLGSHTRKTVSPGYSNFHPKSGSTPRTQLKPVRKIITKPLPVKANKPASSPISGANRVVVKPSPTPAPKPLRVYPPKSSASNNRTVSSTNNVVNNRITPLLNLSSDDLTKNILAIIKDGDFTKPDNAAETCVPVKNTSEVKEDKVILIEDETIVIDNLEEQNNKSGNDSNSNPLFQDDIVLTDEEICDAVETKDKTTSEDKPEESNIQILPVEAEKSTEEVKTNNSSNQGKNKSTPVKVTPEKKISSKSDELVDNKKPGDPPVPSSSNAKRIQPIAVASTSKPDELGTETSDDSTESSEDEQHDSIKKSELNSLFSKFLATCKSKNSRNKEVKIIEKKMRNVYSKNKDVTKDYAFVICLKEAALKVEKKTVECPLDIMKKVYNELRRNDPKMKMKIKRLEKLLEEIRNKIKELEEAEVTSEEDEGDSTYLKLDRYRKKAVEVYSKLCEWSSIPNDAERATRRNVSFMAEVPEDFAKSKTARNVVEKVSRALERYYNKTRKFPDFQDVHKLTVKICVDNEFKIKHSTILQLAKNIFEEFGDLLQSRRLYDDFQICNEYLNEDDDDPYYNDPILAAKLDANKKIRKKEKEVLNKYSLKQVCLKDLESSDESSSSSSHMDFNREEGRKKHTSKGSSSCSNKDSHTSEDSDSTNPPEEIKKHSSGSKLKRSRSYDSESSSSDDSEDSGKNRKHEMNSKRRKEHSSNEETDSSCEGSAKLGRTGSSGLASTPKSSKKVSNKYSINQSDENNSSKVTSKSDRNSSKGKHRMEESEELPVEGNVQSRSHKNNRETVSTDFEMTELSCSDSNECSNLVVHATKCKKATLTEVEADGTLFVSSTCGIVISNVTTSKKPFDQLIEENTFFLSLNTNSADIPPVSEQNSDDTTGECETQNVSAVNQSVGESEDSNCDVTRVVGESDDYHCDVTRVVGESEDNSVIIIPEPSLHESPFNEIVITSVTTSPQKAYDQIVEEENVAFTEMDSFSMEGDGNLI